MDTTTFLAIWGAATGTIGTIAGIASLWLRFTQHRKDQPKLVCNASLGFDFPHFPKHNITVRSVGRRPIIVDYVSYYILPKKMWHQITKRWQHRSGRFIWKQDLKKPLELSEGKKGEIKIFLPQGLEFAKIYKIQVVDQTGRKWPVKWFGEKQRTRLTTDKILEEREFEEGRRIVKLTGRQLGTKFYLETKFDTKPGRMGVTTGRGFPFRSKEDYDSKLKEVIDNQVKPFLNGQTEEIT